MTQSASNPRPAALRRLALLLWIVAAVWLAVVVIAAQAGWIAQLWMPAIALIVAATIVGPTLVYFVSSTMRALVERIGHRRILIMHAWRVPAAMLFFWYGLKGELPFAFWFLAGVGDFIAGSLAVLYAFKPERLERYRSFHRFGFADFVVAVGTGLTFTLMQDPRMTPIAALPLALIPLFGVGISGASHLMAFDMLRRGVGLAESKQARPTALPLAAAP